MKKKKNKSIYIFQGICASVLVIFCLMTYLLRSSTKLAEKHLEEEYKYVSYEILTDNVIPVIKENNNKVIIKPYDDENVTVAKSYYDYKAESKDQENALIYYENTYIQNSGIDYAKKETFNVLAVLEGEVISITEDDIVGKTIKIKHDNEIISIYQSLSEVNVKEHDAVKQGQVIGKSGENAINSKIGNHLHFEIYISNKLVNPENYFNKELGDF